MANSAWSGNTAGLASATSAGLVGTGAQTFAGKKTLDGGALIKGDTTGVAIGSTYVGAKIPSVGLVDPGVISNVAVSNVPITGSLSLSEGHYLIFYQAVFRANGNHNSTTDYQQGGSSAIKLLEAGSTVDSAIYIPIVPYQPSQGPGAFTLTSFYYSDLTTPKTYSLSYDAAKDGNVTFSYRSITNVKLFATRIG